MEARVSPNVKEGWTGPGRRDGTIVPLKPEDDALHIDVGKKNQFEWWYFDAHLEGGYTLVAFFYAAYPNPGLDQGKIAVELTLLRPDGRKTQRVVKYKKRDFYASREKPDVKIGENYMKAEFSNDGFPVYARGTATPGTGVMEDPGEVNVPIACGQVVINPGDILVADEDGIVVVPPAAAKEILAGVAELEAKHSAVQDVLLRGEVTNIANIERKLREQGCEFIEN